MLIKLEWAVAPLLDHAETREGRQRGGLIISVVLEGRLLSFSVSGPHNN